MEEKLFFSNRYRHQRNPSPPEQFTPRQRTAWFDYQNKVKTGVYRLTENPCICGFQEDVLISEVDRYNLDVHIKLCKKCGLMRQDPILDPESLVSFYTHHYRSLYDGGEFNSIDEEFEFRYRHQVPQTFDYISPYLKEGRVLDYGCGGGWLVKYFSDRGFEATGFDYDLKYTSFAIGRGLRIIQGDTDQLQRKGPYDLIVLSHVFEHLADIRGFVRKMEGLLHENGFVFISLPGVLTGSLFGSLQNAHVWYFTLNTLRWVIENNSRWRLSMGDETINSFFCGKEADPFHINALKDEHKRILIHILKKEYRRFCHIKKFLDRVGLLDPLTRLANFKR